MRREAFIPWSGVFAFLTFADHLGRIASICVTCFTVTFHFIRECIMWTIWIHITSTVVYLTAICEHKAYTLWSWYPQPEISYRCKLRWEMNPYLCIPSCTYIPRHWSTIRVNRLNSYHIHHSSLDNYLQRTKANAFHTIGSRWSSIPVQDTPVPESVSVYPVLQVQTTALLSLACEQFAFGSHPPLLTWQASEKKDVTDLYSCRPCIVATDWGYPCRWRSNPCRWICILSCKCISQHYSVSHENRLRLHHIHRSWPGMCLNTKLERHNAIWWSYRCSWR